MELQKIIYKCPCCGNNFSIYIDDNKIQGVVLTEAEDNQVQEILSDMNYEFGIKEGGHDG